MSSEICVKKHEFAHNSFIFRNNLMSIETTGWYARAYNKNRQKPIEVEQNVSGLDAMLKKTIIKVIQEKHL